jgi:hypothetical protein
MLLAPGLANATAPSADMAPAHAEAMADARFKAGLAAYDKGNYEAARLEFLQAQAIYPRPSILRNLALSELHVGRPLDALAHLRAFLADPGTTPDKRALAERSLGEAYAQTGHLSITAPEGAHVRVDGKEVGVAPLKEAVDVPAGLHGVDTDASGVAAHQKVDAAAGKLTEVAFVTPAVSAPVGAAMGAQPAPLPPPVAEPAKGSYWNGRRTVGVIIAGAGAVGMVVGAVFGANRSGETSDASTALGAAQSANPSAPKASACTNPPAAGVAPCTALSNALASNGTDAHVEDSLLIGGAVLVAAGLVTAFWPAGPEGPPAAQLAPIAGPHVAGLQWSGSF